MDIDLAQKIFRQNLKSINSFTAQGKIEEMKANFAKHVLELESMIPANLKDERFHWEWSDARGSKGEWSAHQGLHENIEYLERIGYFQIRDIEPQSIVELFRTHI